MIARSSFIWVIAVASTTSEPSLQAIGHLKLAIEVQAADVVSWLELAKLQECLTGQLPAALKAFEKVVPLP